MRDFDSMKFSQLRELFYELLRALFASGIDTDEDAVFAKYLIEFILQTINDCREKGLEQKMCPVAYVSLWQGVEVEKRDFYKLRKNYLKTIKGTDERNLPDFLNKVQEAMMKWGEECLGGAILIDDDQWEQPDD